MTKIRAWVDALGLSPHPEGGSFCETYRALGAEATAIYFLLRRGERSRWHRVHGADEIWLYHAGAPLTLTTWRGGEMRRERLGLELKAGERPQLIVPASTWQMAESEGDFTLVSCVVAPAFTFDRFELAEPHWSPAEGTP